MRKVRIMRIEARHVARIETTGILDVIAAVVVSVWFYLTYWSY